MTLKHCLQFHVRPYYIVRTLLYLHKVNNGIFLQCQIHFNSALAFFHISHLTGVSALVTLLQKIVWESMFWIGTVTPSYLPWFGFLTECKRDTSFVVSVVETFNLAYCHNRLFVIFQIFLTTTTSSTAKKIVAIDFFVSNKFPHYLFPGNISVYYIQICNLSWRVDCCKSVLCFQKL